MLCSLRPFMRLLLLVALLAAAPLAAQDTLLVRAHQRATIVTDPAAGVRAYPLKLRFPSARTAVRKALLTLTLACPTGLRCADWDYLDHVLVRPLSGTDTFEVARVLTPYGGQFGPDWRFTWQADITDFLPVLRDSAEVIYVHSGYEPNEDRGWALSLDFRFVQGPPAAEVLAVQQLYRGHFAYGDPARSVEEDLPLRAVATDPRAALLRVRMHHTGHGMNTGDGCGEFCRKWRSVKVDGREVSRTALWKECGHNPLYPQAGTWIFDRANWCPGELQPSEAVTVPIAGGGRPLDKHTVDIDLEPYAHDSSTARTSIAAYAVQLARPRALHDAAVEAILLPSDDPRHARLNPAVHEPRVVLRNNGEAPLDLLLIRYGTEGFRERSYVHARRIAFGATDTVTLPHLIDMKPGRNTFTVSVHEPNGHKDGWKHDNALRSTFTAADVLDSVLIVQLRTNAEPQHNAISLASTRGRLHIDRPLGALRPDTLYTDTLHLPPASYVLQLADTAGDGLEFWYNAKGGRGFLRLLDGQGRLLKRFQSDCGNGLQYQFRVGGPSTVAPDAAADIGLFPTRTTGPTVLDYFANVPGALRIRVVGEDGAEAALIEPPAPVKELILPIDLSDMPRGRYTVKVERDGAEVFSRRLRLVED